MPSYFPPLISNSRSDMFRSVSLPFLFLSLCFMYQDLFSHCTQIWFGYNCDVFQIQTGADWLLHMVMVIVILGFRHRQKWHSLDGVTAFLFFFLGGGLFDSPKDISNTLPFLSTLFLLCPFLSFLWITLLSNWVCLPWGVKKRVVS